MHGALLINKKVQSRLNVGKTAKFNVKQYHV